MNVTISTVRQLVSRIDWSLLKSSAVITIGMIIARGVGFIVSFLQAHYFNPADFGTIQYNISLAGILAVIIQPFGQHVLARYVGMGKGDPKRLGEIMSNGWLMLAAIFSISLLVGIPLLILTKTFTVGVMVIFLGTSAFYMYWGVARGYLSSGRLISAEIGNNLVQVLMLVGLIGMIGLKSITLAMFIQGLSCFVPLILLQAFWPLEIIFDKSLLRRNVIYDMTRFSIPVWISHASYMLYMTVAILFLDYFTNKTLLGVFSLACTLSILFSFLPTGLATILMPKIASSQRSHRNTLLINALGLALLIDMSMLALYYLAAPSLVRILFGTEYLAVPEIFFLTAVVMTLIGVHAIISSAFVGSGLAQEETKSRLVTVFVATLSCWGLIPRLGVIGAAWSMLIGIASGLVVYAWIYWRTWFR